MQEKGWGVGLSGAKAQPGLAAEARSHKKLPGHRILSRMPDTHPETIAPAPPRALIGWRLLAFFYDLLPSLALGMLASLWFRSEEHTSELQSLMRLSYDVL